MLVVVDLCLRSLEVVTVVLMPAVMLRLAVELLIVDVVADWNGIKLEADDLTIKNFV